MSVDPALQALATQLHTIEGLVKGLTTFRGTRDERKEKIEREVKPKISQFTAALTEYGSRVSSLPAAERATGMRLQRDFKQRINGITIQLRNIEQQAPIAAKSTLDLRESAQRDRALTTHNAAERMNDSLLSSAQLAEEIAQMGKAGLADLEEQVEIENKIEGHVQHIDTALDVSKQILDGMETREKKCGWICWALLAANIICIIVSFFVEYGSSMVSEQKSKHLVDNIQFLFTPLNLLDHSTVDLSSSRDVTQLVQKINEKIESNGDTSGQV